MSSWQQWATHRAERAARTGIERTTRTARPDALDLASNDYLGLSQHPAVLAAAAQHLAVGPLGAGASRVVTGTHPAHEELEAELCALTGARAALAFSSGYTANLGVLGALAGPRSRLLLDAQAHASLHDGAQLAHAEVQTFAHNDLAELRALLADDRGRRTTVVVESVYSVLGDSAPLPELAALCRDFDAALLVDEAHTIATLPEGSWVGRAGLWDVPGAPPVLVSATLSKALGAQGGAILLGGDDAELWRAHLVNLARAFIFDTGLAPVVAAGAAQACRIARTSGLPERLAANRERIISAMRQRPLTAQHLETGAGAVISLRMPSPTVALAAAQTLRERGILVGCFRPPSVPDRIARLRLTAHANTPPERLDLALAQVADVVETAWGAPTACPFQHADGRPEERSTDHRLVSEPAQVREVLGRPTDFAASNSLQALRPFCREAVGVLVRAGFRLPPVLASANGEEHRAVRRVVTPFFSPGKVKAQREVVRRLVREELAELAPRLAEGVDLATTIAAHAPAQIASGLTGVPNPPHDQLARWSADSLELFWGWPDDARQLQLAQSAAEFHPWLRQAVRASTGTGNLFDALAAEGLSEDQIVSLGYFLVIAGQETTRMLIATCLHRALSEPQRWSACGDPETGEQAAQVLVGEVLAEMSSVPTWRRVALRDTMLAGQPVSAGDELLVQLSGGHTTPEEADAALAFGHGIHRCLGAALAEMEATVILHETARALAHACPGSGEVPWLRLLSFQSPRTVLVTQR